MNEQQVLHAPSVHIAAPSLRCHSSNNRHHWHCRRRRGRRKNSNITHKSHHQQNSHHHHHNNNNSISLTRHAMFKALEMGQGDMLAMLLSASQDPVDPGA
jgi:hypothetical protein